MNHKAWAISAGIFVCVARPSLAAGDPADAGTPVPPISYRSPFADYRPLGDDKATAWKEANETVRVIGGWRAYARESAEAAKAAKVPAIPVSPALRRENPTVVPPANSAPAAPHQKHGG